mmetsp:Transcript_19716/g.47075  ORF Transcript_19716/g.47075 Transcript_19716/m.47075 type:complete len:294 (-) Transcript_19716:314-1195(-)
MHLGDRLIIEGHCNGCRLSDEELVVDLRVFVVVDRRSQENRHHKLRVMGIVRGVKAACTDDADHAVCHVCRMELAVVPLVSIPLLDAERVVEQCLDRPRRPQGCFVQLECLNGALDHSSKRGRTLTRRGIRADEVQEIVVRDDPPQPRWDGHSGQFEVGCDEQRRGPLPAAVLQLGALALALQSLEFRGGCQALHLGLVIVTGCRVVQETDDRVAVGAGVLHLLAEIRGVQVFKAPGDEVLQARRLVRGWNAAPDAQVERPQGDVPGGAVVSVEKVQHLGQGALEVESARGGV